MRASGLRRHLCIVMMVIFPASMMMADTSAAMLSTSGHAMLNGAKVAHSTTVFSGDRIDTSMDSAATISASGSTVLVPASSSVQFRGDVIELQSGSAVVSTIKGLKVHVGDLTVAPVSGSAKYDVSTSGEHVIIAARTGSLSLVDADGTTTTLQEGSTTSSKKSRRKGGAVPGMGGGGGAGAVGAMGSGKAIVIGSAAAAAAIAIALVSTDSPPAVSPRNP
jgi:hypothetical protein